MYLNPQMHVFFCGFLYIYALLYNVDLSRQLLFLFSALGAFNGLFLSLYFAFFLNKKRKANYFLSALLFVLSIRIIKSVFFYFNPSLSGVFIQVGISACVLIGPFLYLYSSMQVSKKERQLLVVTRVSSSTLDHRAGNSLSLLGI